jgi:hypothetical protein
VAGYPFLLFPFDAFSFQKTPQGSRTLFAGTTATVLSSILLCEQLISVSSMAMTLAFLAVDGESHKLMQLSFYS